MVWLTWLLNLFKVYSFWFKSKSKVGQLHLLNERLFVCVYFLKVSSLHSSIRKNVPFLLRLPRFFFGLFWGHFVALVIMWSLLWLTWSLSRTMSHATRRHKTVWLLLHTQDFSFGHYYWPGLVPKEPKWWATLNLVCVTLMVHWLSPFATTLA